MNTSRDGSKHYSVEVSGRFIILSFVVSILFASSVGWVARIAIEEIRMSSNQGYVKERSMPRPLLLEGKEVPQTFYTSKNFDTSKAATMSSLYLERKDTSGGSIKVPIDFERTDSCGNDKDEGQCARGNYVEEEEEYLPAGQHLLVDIKNVDGSFLNSEERLAQAMVGVVNEAKLTLLSYHCHSLIPIGVSCVGVLLESHVSFHTWPEEGVITLDLFTCGSDLLVPVMPVIKRLFAIRQEPDDDNDIVSEPVVLWSHKMRGFRPDTFVNHLVQDLGDSILDDLHLDMKEEIAAVQTDYQRIDIYDVLSPDELSISQYKLSISNDGSYESKNPKLFLPDRIVFLDGVQQSSRYGSEAYHEALVHPAMLSHANPKRVAIIGGGECATLREVLKHNTVEKVKMIEIDEIMVNVSREHLPDWSDCSDIVGSVDGWCGLDPRAELYFEDAMAWFMDRFADDKLDTPKFEEEKYDVIIMDALDPQDDVPFAKVLYESMRFTKSLYNSLNDNGLIVFQVGASPDSDSGPDESTDQMKASLQTNLEKSGFHSIHLYEESHCEFEDPWSFLVAIKSKEGRKNWYSNIAEIDLEIHSRILRTYSEKPNLKFFDGATMQIYQNPHRVFENVFCRSDPKPESCYYLDSEVEKEDIIPMSDFEVKMSSTAENSGRGVYTKVEIEEGSFIGMEESTQNVFFWPSTVHILHNVLRLDDDSAVEDVLDYMDGYGWQSNLMGGEEEYGVDSGIHTFVNHGCKGTFNICSSNIEKYTEELTDIDAFKVNYIDEKKFDPHRDRHLFSSLNEYDVAVRNVKAGEELLCNYMAFTTKSLDIESDMNELRAICDGKSEGLITILEKN